MEKDVITPEEFKEFEVLKKKGQIVPVYVKMTKGNDVKYASAMIGVYELMDKGYKYELD